MTFAVKGPAEHLDVLAGTGQGPVGGLSVPALHYLRAGDTEAQNQPTPGQVVQGYGVHGGSRRGTSCHLDDAGTKPDPLGVGGQVHQRREGIAAPRFGGPDGVVTQAFGLLDR